MRDTMAKPEVTKPGTAITSGTKPRATRAPPCSNPQRQEETTFPFERLHIKRTSNGLEVIPKSRRRRWCERS